MRTEMYKKEKEKSRKRVDTETSHGTKMDV
jgi:hypothetical protein